jgi:hypothetical protein
VDYKWELALGDEPLTEEELKALTELRSPLVRLRGPVGRAGRQAASRPGSSCSPRPAG